MSKRFFQGAIALLVLVGVSWLGMNLVVQSNPVRERLEGAMTEALGIPVRIGGISSSPWGGLRISEVSARDSSAPQSYTLDEVGAKVRLLSLLSNTIVINEITFTGPAMRIAPTRKDPQPGPSGPSGRQPPPEDRSPPVKEPAQPGQTADTPSAPQSPDGRARRQVDVRSVQVRGGAFDFQDSDEREVVSARGIEIKSHRIKGIADLEGEMRVAMVEIFQSARIRDLTTPVLFREKKLSLPLLDGKVGDSGGIQGRVEVDTGEPLLPFDAGLALTGIAVRDLLPPGAGITERIEGAISGNFHLEGDFEDRSTHQGNAAVRLDNARLLQTPLLRTIGQALRIDELEQLELDDTRITARMENGHTFVDELTLRSQNLRLEATGEVDINGNLNLNAALFIHKSIRRQLPEMAKTNMIEIGDGEYSKLEFSISGTLTDPESDLMNKLVGDGIERTINRLIRGLRGR